MLNDSGIPWLTFIWSEVPNKNKQKIENKKLKGLKLKSYNLGIASTINACNPSFKKRECNFLNFEAVIKALKH